MCARYPSCQRSVLVSIHSHGGLHLLGLGAVKDLCWCQSTASRDSGTTIYGCQRSVLVSIHSIPIKEGLRPMAVKDLCWCQSTAMQGYMPTIRGLSKICAGVNPQHGRSHPASRRCCQRSVLVSIHSGARVLDGRFCAVKDLCWCQSTARRTRSARLDQLSKICAGVNPQPALQWPSGIVRCQRSVLVSIHS